MTRVVAPGECRGAKPLCVSFLSPKSGGSRGLKTKSLTEVRIMKKDAGKETKGESLLAQVLNMAGLVDYQKGAVVSRQIINKQTGTVTVFAFDKGEGLSEHTAPFDALVQILDGEAEVTISGKPNKLVTGEMIIMPANAPHALKALARFKMALIMIRS
jgi:quercetin dioxygenase-like cupin family protein